MTGVEQLLTDGVLESYRGQRSAGWDDHIEVDKALEDDSYLDRKLEMLDHYGLKLWAISNHLVGQVVCDHPIDERHQGILPPRMWGGTASPRASASALLRR